MRTSCARTSTPRNLLGEAGDGLARVLGYDELRGRSEPVEAKLETSGTDPVGGEAPDAELVEPGAERFGPFTECRVVRLERVASAGRATGPDV